MSNSQGIIDKALVLMDQHLTQLRIHSTTMTKDGDTKGLTAYDSQVIERYTKLALAMTKNAPKDDQSDEELLAEAAQVLEANKQGQDNESATSDGE